MIREYFKGIFVGIFQRWKYEHKMKYNFIMKMTSKKKVGWIGRASFAVNTFDSNVRVVSRAF